MDRVVDHHSERTYKILDWSSIASEYLSNCKAENMTMLDLLEYLEVISTVGALQKREQPEDKKWLLQESSASEYCSTDNKSIHVHSLPWKIEMRKKKLEGPILIGGFFFFFSFSSFHSLLLVPRFLSFKLSKQKVFQLKNIGSWNIQNDGKI